MNTENFLKLCKLKDHLTALEAEFYFCAEMGFEKTHTLDHIKNLINEGKIDLYLQPLAIPYPYKNRISHELQNQYSICEFKGLQKLTEIYFSFKHASQYDDAEGFISINGGAKITGDALVKKQEQNVKDEDGSDLKANHDINRDSIVKNITSKLTDDMIVTFEEADFFVIIKKELDQFIAKLKEPNRTETFLELELRAENEQLRNEINGLKKELDELSKNPSNSIFLALGRAYELYHEQNPSRHTQDNFIIDLRDEEKLHGMSPRNLQDMLAKANTMLKDIRKK